jgi:hypothetical protein
MPLDKYVDASLVLVPSGRKAGKAYSQIPTDGDGDLTLSRASIKTEVDTSGNVVSLADNVPGLDFSLGAGLSLFVFRSAQYKYLPLL